MTRSAAGAIVCVLAGLSLVSETRARSAALPAMQTVWTVQPPAAEPTDDFRPPSMEIFYKQRLLPIGVALLGTNYANPRVPGGVLPAGSQLFNVSYEPAEVYCAINHREGSKVEQFIALKLPSWLCFVDEDRDGKFEASFWAKSQVKGLPNLTGLLPTHLPPITPISYTVDNRTHCSHRSGLE